MVYRLKRDTISLEELTLFRQEYQKKSRDNARTPMQWDDSAHGGFTESDCPWMMANPNYPAINVAAQLQDFDSVFHCWRSVLEMRKRYRDIIIYGTFDLVDEANEKVFAYTRTSPDGKILVVCSFSTESLWWLGMTENVLAILVTTMKRTVESLKGEKIQLSPFEALAVLLDEGTR